MDLQRIGRMGSFLAGTVIGGLALAFVVVFFHPELLSRRTVTAAPATEAASLAPPAAAAGAQAAYVTAPAVRPAPEKLDLGSYAAAVKRAAPAVVTVYTSRTVREQIQPSPLNQLFGDFTPRYRSGVQRALGSGVIADSAGHVLTNNHVIENADTIMVQLPDGRVTRATVVGRDPDTDLAVLAIKLINLPIMPLGRSDQIQVGDPVLAIGNPLGLPQTVTHGIVSATGRGQLGLATFENFIQTDAAINTGNSGGALINAQGELIGINTAVAKNSADIGGLAGIGFAIPVNLVRGVLVDILDHGRVIRGWIGAVLEDVDDTEAAQLGLPRGGVVVSNMYVHSPADAAGIHRGDIITRTDGVAAVNAQNTLALIATKKPGATIKLHLLRGNGALDLSLLVTEPPRAN